MNRVAPVGRVAARPTRFRARTLRLGPRTIYLAGLPAPLLHSIRQPQIPPRAHPRDRSQSRSGVSLMSWPLSQDYNEAIQSPGRNFADPDLRGGEVAVNPLGLPLPCSGNFADVYQVRGADGQRWAVKCSTRAV